MGTIVQSFSPSLACGHLIEADEKETVMSTHDKFCTAINSMDGRVQMPVIEYLRRRLGVEYVDMITEPGPNRILGERREPSAMAAILKSVGMSVETHRSRAIAIVGHHDCPGNPAAKDKQWVQCLAAAKLLKEKFPGVEVLPLWVNERWAVEEVQAS
jgi:hypothetical protein